MSAESTIEASMNGDNGQKKIGEVVESPHTTNPGHNTTSLSSVHNTNTSTNNNHNDTDLNGDERQQMINAGDNVDEDILHSLPNPKEMERVKSQTNSEKRKKLLQTIAGVAGNVLEWYDFAAFGFFSDVIGKVFFPPQEGNAAMIESFTVFGSAFLMRPVGGMLMGYIGDLYGRKRALEISIFLMAFPTFTMGCLPGYDRVGMLAAVLLTLVRLIQGLSVGGQLVSSLVFTVESAPREQWGYQGSWVMSASSFGVLLGGIISYFIRSSLDDDELYAWGWRIPFLSGILVSLSGIYLKFFCEEDTIDNHHISDGAGGTETRVNPIKMAFSRENFKSLITATLVPMLWSGGGYITFVWLATYMAELIENPIPGARAFAINSASLFFSNCAFFPVAGILSDKFGRKAIMYTGGITICLISPIMFTFISSGNSYTAFFAQSCLGICLSLWGSPMCAWLVESFPAHMRLTSVAVGYNIAQALIGGFSPAIATWMVTAYPEYKSISPGIYISVIALLSLIGLSISPTTSGQSSAYQQDSMKSQGTSESDETDPITLA